MINTYAKLNNDNIVENLIVCNDSNISYLNGAFIKIEERHLTNCNPSIGDTYFPEKDKFKEKQWWDSWTWDEELWKYIPPVAKPSTGNWLWNEDNEEWFEVIPTEE
jgi:hypothetical protein